MELKKYLEWKQLSDMLRNLKEKEKGLVLVFTHNNHRRLHWTEDGNIIVTVSFGNDNRLENCFIHHDDIIALYSPDAMVKYDRWDILNIDEATKQQKDMKDIGKDERHKSKIVSLEKYRNKNKG